jgi:ACS family tartrate transporter-like MFS transporter
MAGVLAVISPYFALPSSFLRGPAAAGGIALINMIVSLGGFVGPTLIGVLRQETGGYAAGMAALAVGLLVSALIVLAVGRAMAPRATVSRASTNG